MTNCDTNGCCPPNGKGEEAPEQTATEPTATEQAGATAARAKARPRTDVFETPDTLVLVADVPGADSDSIELELQENVLTLRARPASATPAGWQPAGAEFELPDYERSFRLSTDIDREGISASILNGRLRVVLKKRQRSNRVEVRAG